MGPGADPPGGDQGLSLEPAQARLEGVKGKVWDPVQTRLVEIKG